MATTPTPQPSAPQEPTLQEKIAAIVQAVTKGMSGAMDQGSSPAQVISPGGAPQRLHGSPAQRGPSSSNPTYGGVSAPGLRQYEFATKQGKQAAITSSAIQNVTQVLDNYKKEKEAKDTKHAENTFNQVFQAIQNQDQDTLNLLLGGKEGSKNLKLMENALGYVFPRDTQEPPPPEAKGFQAALKKLVGGGKDQYPKSMPNPGQPGGVHLPKAGPAELLQSLVQQRQLQSAQSDPQYLQKLATGSTLSGKDLQNAEKIKEGLSPSADAVLGAWEKMQTQMQKGYSPQVRGDIPVVKGPDGKEYVYGDKNAPPDAQAMLSAMRDSQEAAWKHQAEMQSRNIAATMSRFVQEQDRKDKGEAMKIWGSAMDADGRLTRMKSYMASALDPSKPNQQSMFGLVSEHIAMTIGAGSKVRPTKTMWDEAVQTGALSDRIQAKFDKNGYLTGVVLTPEQMQQMVSNAEEKRKSEWQGAYRQSKFYGLKGAPDTLPGLTPVAPPGEAPAQGGAPEKGPLD